MKRCCHCGEWASARAEDDTWWCLSCWREAVALGRVVASAKKIGPWQLLSKQEQDDLDGIDL